MRSTVEWGRHLGMSDALDLALSGPRPMANPCPFNLSSMDRPHSKGRSDGFSESSSSNCRASILPSVKFPSLWKLDTSEGPPHHGKSPLLILRLTSPSFLHSHVEDEARHSLYTIRTVGNLTTVMRSDPWEGMTKTADIRWPEYFTEPKGKGKKSDGVQVQMRGNRWVDCETFLKTGSSSCAPRKFSIPNFPQSLKWRVVGSSYWCTAPSVKGPVAILDPAIASVPAQLQVFESLHDKNDIRPMLDHRGVSILLLDYILVTSILLVTEPQEWTFPKRLEENNSSSSPEAPNSIDLPGSNGIATLQWRKVMYGEPIFPRLQVQSALSSPISDAVPPTPTSPDTLAKTIQGVSLSSSHPDLNSSSDSDQIREVIISSPESSRPASPATESVLCRTTSAAAPSHIYLDPSFYSDDTTARPEQSHIITSSPSYSNAPSQTPIDLNYSNYQYPSLTQVSRPHSTPPHAQGEESFAQSPIPSPSLPPTPSRVGPPSSRPLPRPPDSSVASRGLRQARSQQGLRNGLPEKRGSYGQRALPSPPPPLPPPSSLNAFRLGPVVDAGPVIPPPSYPQRTSHHTHIAPTHFNIHASPHSLYPDPIAHSLLPRNHHQKTPEEDDQARWMATRQLADDDGIPTTYDVPPPAYSSINFNE